jgi:uncharacterized protein YqjF (DUF2071 family)
MAKPFLTAQWRNLLMINFAVTPALLQKYVPHRTELDTWNDTYYISHPPYAAPLAFAG